MAKHIHLRYSDDVPGSALLRSYLRYSDEMPGPTAQSIEQFAMADRRSLKCRFGEPCDPRKLIRFYDVRHIVETSDDYQQHYGRTLHKDTFAKAFSGVTIPINNGENLILINPFHSLTRRNFTIAHEFGHLVLNHQPIIIREDEEFQPRYSDIQEFQAHHYGLAILLPYAPLVQMLRQGASIKGIAHHYVVSPAAVEMRMKISGLWGLQTIS
jgi:Zn-dependent peptidase ImmA (M78 family)